MRTGVAALVLSVSLAFRMCVRKVVPRLRLQRASCQSQLTALRVVRLLWGDLLHARWHPLKMPDLAKGFSRQFWNTTNNDKTGRRDRTRHRPDRCAV